MLDALGIEQPVDVIGHDWGGWTGFILCLRHPERIRRFLALNIYHPFLRPRPAGLLSLWRFWYQWLLAAPGIGSRANRLDPVLRWVGATQAGWSERERAIFTDQFREPERARAGSLLYRHAVTRLAPRVLRGEYRRIGMPTEALQVFGTADRPQSHRALPGYESSAPNMSLELVPGVGHFIVDERPELVLDRAREFLLR